MSEAPFLPFLEEESDEASNEDVSGTVTPGEGDRRRLLAGEINDEEFLDLQIERATVHLEAQLSPARLQAMRDILREELTSDPELIELLQRARERDGSPRGR